MTIIYLVRHGQASFGSANYDELSPLGHRQGTILGAHFKRLGTGFDGAWCGRMARQRDTALRVLDELAPGTAPAVDPDFDEYDFLSVLRAYLPAVRAETPTLELDPRGLPSGPRAFQEAFERCVALWVREHQHSGAPIETWKAFCDRAVRGLRTVATPQRQRVLIATSGGIIAAALREALGLDDDTAFALNWRIYNASVHRFRMGRRGLSLLGFNDVAHLELAGEPALLTFR